MQKVNLAAIRYDIALAANDSNNTTHLSLSLELGRILLVEVQCGKFSVSRLTSCQTNSMQIKCYTSKNRTFPAQVNNMILHNIAIAL